MAQKFKFQIFSKQFFFTKCNSKFAAFYITIQHENYEVPHFAERGSPCNLIANCHPTLSNLFATIPFSIALFISIFISHYNVALLKKAIDFRIDRGESQLFGSICRRIHSTYIRQRRLLPHSNQW